ncbi:MAG TPA: hypothetical protein P5180_03870 [Bacteroidales bacterium]|nr:hypothetical protein [Bacteroidales bacterium]HPJ58135.1 hypothetical protein [Bacteroidales bacterium]HRW84545.1 hypothetical protein [Bacteroidales bacterium]
MTKYITINPAGQGVICRCREPPKGIANEVSNHWYYMSSSQSLKKQAV